MARLSRVDWCERKLIEIGQYSIFFNQKRILLFAVVIKDVLFYSTTVNRFFKNDLPIAFQLP